ncbi:MAG: GIDE domain-containing protein [Haloferacaceae archaeon]
MAPVSDFDVVFLLLVATAVGVFFAVVVGAQGRDGRRWWRSRFGVGWPTILFLYCLLVAGLWLPVALGTEVPGRTNLAYFAGGLLFVGGCIPLARSVGNVRSLLVVSLTSVVHGSDASPGRLAVEGAVEAAETVGAGEATEATESDVDGGTVEAPLSGARSVACRLKVDAVPADGTDRERRRNRETVANVECARRFLVRDETGAVPVDPDGAQLRISGDGERTVDPDDDAPASLASVLEREGVSRDGSTLLCEEATLEPGDDVFVLGTASRRDIGVVVDGGREFLVVPGSRSDVRSDLLAVVLWGGVAGAVLALAGEAAMAFLTGAL